MTVRVNRRRSPFAAMTQCAFAWHTLRSIVAHMERFANPAPKTRPFFSIERRCVQCGEKLATHPQAMVALPSARTPVQLCSDCSVHDLPHTD
jgi:hypothetical protein